MVRPGNKLSATLCWLSKPITDRSPGIRSRHPLPNRLNDNPVKEHGRPQIALSTTPSPFGCEVSRVLIKHPTRSGAGPPGIGWCGAAFWDCPSTTWSFAQGPTPDQKVRSRLRAGDRHAESDRLGLAGQSARQRYNAERRNKGMDMLKITPPVTDWASRLECHTPPGAAAVYAIRCVRLPPAVGARSHVLVP